MKIAGDDVIRLRFVTEEGRPPFIKGYYFRSEQDRASRTLSVYRTQLPTEAQQAAFQSFAASHAIQVENIKERNWLRF